MAYLPHKNRSHWILYSESTEVHSFFARYKRPEDYLEAYDENFTFFRALEKGLWDYIFIDSNSWYYLPKESRRRLSRYRHEMSHAGYFIYIKNDESFSQKSLEQNLFYQEDKSPHEFKRLFDFFLLWPLGEQYCKEQLQLLKERSAFHAYNKISGYLASDNVPLPLLSGKSPEAQSLGEVFNRTRRQPNPILLVGERGFLSHDLAYILHQWQFSQRKNHIRVNIKQAGTLIKKISPQELFEANIKSLYIYFDSDSKEGTPRDLPPFWEHLTDLGIKVILASDENNRQVLRLQERIERLDTWPIPSLRHRREDIVEISHQYLAAHGLSPQKQLQESATQVMQDYSWPGNYAELKGLLDLWLSLQLKAPSGINLPLYMYPHSSIWNNIFHLLIEKPHSLSWQRIEQNLLQGAFVEHSRSVAKTARFLGMGRKALEYRLKKYGIL